MINLSCEKPHKIVPCLNCEDAYQGVKSHYYNITTIERNV
jgi:hypothetical protein